MKKLSYYVVLSLGLFSFVYLSSRYVSQSATSTTVSSVDVNTSATLSPQSDNPLNLSSKLNKPVDKTIHQVTPNAGRVLFLYGEVGDATSSVTEDIKRLGKDGKDPIYLLINSPGGSVLDGALVISAIEGSKAPVYTVCMQLCASMAAIIHQYGKERMMTDRSILMFHNAAGGAQGYIPQMLSRLTVINRYVNKMDAHIAERAGLNLTDFLGRLGDEIWLDAEDSTAQHFNDKIVNVVLPDNKGIALPLLPSNEVKSVIDLDWK